MLKAEFPFHAVIDALSHLVHVKAFLAVLVLRRSQHWPCRADQLCQKPGHILLMEIQMGSIGAL